MKDAITVARLKTMLAQLQAVAIDEFINQTWHFPDSATRSAEIASARAEMKETLKTLVLVTIQVWEYSMDYGLDMVELDGAALFDKHPMLTECSKDTIINVIRQVAAEEKNEDIQAFFGMMLGIIHMSWLHWLKDRHRRKKAA